MFLFCAALKPQTTPRDMSGFYRCSICQVVSRDIVQHDKHLTGKRHARNVELAVSGAGAGAGADRTRGSKRPSIATSGVSGAGGRGTSQSKASSKRAKRRCFRPPLATFHRAAQRRFERRTRTAPHRPTHTQAPHAHSHSTHAHRHKASVRQRHPRSQPCPATLNRHANAWWAACWDPRPVG